MGLILDVYFKNKLLNSTQLLRLRGLLLAMQTLGKGILYIFFNISAYLKISDSTRSCPDPAICCKKKKKYATPVQKSKFSKQLFEIKFM